MQDWNFKEFTGFTGWGEEGDFIYEIDIETLFNLRNQRALAEY